jgi:hypothetical protein
VIGAADSETRNRRSPKSKEGTHGDGRALRLPNPFGSLAATRYARKAHGFASPPFGGFALSRRKGVAVSDKHAEACPVIATKTDNHVFATEI